jgi:hypothetical protein
MPKKLRLMVVLTAAFSASYVALAQAPPDSKERPFYYAQEITPSDLEGRSLRELSLMRNTIYARAGNKFRKKWLNDYFSAQPWYHPLDPMDETKITPLDRKNAEAIAAYDAGLTHDQLFAMQNDLIMGNGAQTPERKLELRLLSARLGKWKGADTDADRSPLEDPSLLDKQLTLDQLKDFSRRDLRMLRNLIYARRGRPFHSELVQAYFQAVDWYKSDPTYTDARLTALDRRNINVVLSMENSLGGPLTDYEHKKEDGWFARA